MDARPPGHTCPNIDRAQSAFRRMTWRMRRLHDGPIDDEFEAILRKEITDLAAEGIAALEEVRADNTQMRAAHAEAFTENKRLRALLAAPAVETP
jgi:hypothetical protein